MTPEAQRWRDHFAAWEADQLRRFPLKELETPLEKAEYNLALDYLQTQFPQDKLQEWRVKPVKRRDPIAFFADTPTRKAFFDSIGTDHSGDIFCLWREERDSIFSSTSSDSSSLHPYTMRSHNFTNYMDIPEEIRSFFIREPLPKSISPHELILQQWSWYIGPLAARGTEKIWHWNGESLIHLPEYGSHWVS